MLLIALGQAAQGVGVGRLLADQRVEPFEGELWSPSLLLLCDLRRAAQQDVAKLASPWLAPLSWLSPRA